MLLFLLFWINAHHPKSHNFQDVTNPRRVNCAIESDDTQAARQYKQQRAAMLPFLTQQTYSDLEAAKEGSSDSNEGKSSSDSDAPRSDDPRCRGPN